MTKSTNNVFDHNLFYNLSCIKDHNGPLSNANALLTDPGFVNMGGETPEDYKLGGESPAIAAGRIIEDNGGRDFFGNVVSADSPPNIGACNANNSATDISAGRVEEEMFTLYPGITDKRIWIKTMNSLDDVNIRITSLTGELLGNENFRNVVPGSIEFDISRFRDGMYIVSVQTIQGSQSKLFIKIEP
jgi:hypothetical protein